MQTKILNIAYAINEAYVDYCIVSIASILKNNSGKQISFHILTDSLSAKAKSKIQDLITHHNLGGGNILRNIGFKGQSSRIERMGQICVVSAISS